MQALLLGKAIIMTPDIQPIRRQRVIIRKVAGKFISSQPDRGGGFNVILNTFDTNLDPGKPRHRPALQTKINHL